MRVLLKISYDGTNYKGWQITENGPSIKEVLSEKLKILLGEDINIYILSRTDAGVHAKCNFATFDTNKNINPDKIYYAINDLLPHDISIIESKLVSDDFDIKKVNTRKTYVYTIHNAKVRDPLKEHFAHFVWYDINIDLMREGAKYLIGTKCFLSFVNPDAQVLQDKTIDEKKIVSTRTIYDIKIDKIDDMIYIKVVGDKFMYNMVRIIAGTLLKIGMKLIEPNDLEDIINKCDRKYAGFTLPGKGLCLENVDFV